MTAHTIRIALVTIFVAGLVSGVSAQQEDSGIIELMPADDVEQNEPEPGFVDPDQFKSPSQTESSTTPALFSSLDDEKADADITGIFEDNDQFKNAIGDFAESKLSVPVRLQGYGGKGIQVQVVDPNAADITPEQKLGVLIHIFELEIKNERKALMQMKDVDARNEQLEELRELYVERFTVDTAYQDFKVREIERRAKKLREEVTNREQSCKEWADAMVTLAKMQANGIETMSETPSSLPRPSSRILPGELPSPPIALPAFSK